MAGPATLYQTGIHSARPAASAGCVLYSCTTHSKVYKSDGSAWTDWMTIPTGASVATDPIFDAAGDLAVGSGADTAAKLTLGATGKAPVSNGSTLVYAYPPGYEYDYAQTTSLTTISATSEATANTIVTGAAVSYDGSTVVMIEVFLSHAFSTTGVDEDLIIVLYDGSSSIGFIGSIRTPATSHRALWSGTLQRRLTPSNASHTYSARAYVPSGSGAAGGGAGGSGNLVPAFIRQTKV